MSRAGLTAAEEKHLLDCTWDHSACTRIGRPYGGKWGEWRHGGNIEAIRSLEAKGLLTFHNLHRDSERALIRSSVITAAGLDAIRRNYVLGKPPEGHEEIAIEAWQRRAGRTALAAPDADRKERE